MFNISLARNLRRRQMTLPNRLGIFGLRFLQSGKMLLGDYQHMRRGFRIDIFKSKHVFILKNFGGRNLTP